MPADGFADPQALHQLLDGADTLIHAASYIGAPWDLQQSVNVGGTERLLAAAKRMGVRRVIYLNTATVYGSSWVNGFREGQLEVQPNTALSASRARAEEMVLDFGGTVIGPNMVYGLGDRWFIGRYASML